MRCRAADVKWFEVNPCYVFHGLNAYEENGNVIYDACRISEIWREAGSMEGGTGTQSFHRFTFNLETGGVNEETLDERGMDFPKVADARVGLKHRYAYTLQFGGTGFAGLLKFDMDKGSSELHS